MVSTRMEGHVDELELGYVGLAQQMVTMSSCLEDLDRKIERRDFRFDTLDGFMQEILQCISNEVKGKSNKSAHISLTIIIWDSIV